MINFKPIRLGYLALVVAVLSASACEAPDAEVSDAVDVEQAPPAPVAVAPKPKASAEPKGGIAWHDGDVDAAFARARAEAKPLFLYWGAEWCPPCQQIKATIFKRRAFIERSRQFVPVYLNGDTDSAQRVGEDYGVLGYPTMIVFASDGTEITRIPGGLDIEQYAGVLDLAMSNVRPIKTVIAALGDGPQGLSDDDYRLLAYYSWGQDNERALVDVDRLALLQELSADCPPHLEAAGSRLYAEYLRAAIAASNDEENPSPMLPEQKAAARERIAMILGQPELVAANMYLLLYDSAKVVRALSDPGSPEREALAAAWTAALDRVAADESVSTAERVNTGWSKLQLARVDDGEAPLPEALVAEIRDRVAWADSVTTNAYERQAVTNSTWYLLWNAGLEAEAEALLEAELGKSKSPYYFMLDLAEVAQRAGRTEEAIGWLERAYDGAVGPATRFQWGANYVMGLLEMAPEDVPRIERESLRVLAELEGKDDAFHGRYKRYLGRLEDKYRSWNESGERAATLAEIRTGVLALCVALPAADDGRATCEAFLAET